MCMRGAKVYYFIPLGKEEKGAKDLYVFCRFSRDAVLPTFLIYPRATSCESDKVLCRLSECGRVRCSNNRSKASRVRDQEARVVALQKEGKRVK